MLTSSRVTTVTGFGMSIPLVRRRLPVTMTSSERGFYLRMDRGLDCTQSNHDCSRQT